MTRLQGFMHVSELQLLRLLAVQSVAYTSGETKCLNGLKHIQHQARGVMSAAVIICKHLCLVVQSYHI